MRTMVSAALVSSACALGSLGCNHDDGTAAGGAGGATSSDAASSTAGELIGASIANAASSISSSETSSSSTGSSCPTPEMCGYFVDQVLSVTYGPAAGFGQSEMPCVIQGPPHGGGDHQGSLDVLTLGNGGSITLSFGAQLITDGPGPDFIVFENPFYAGDDPNAVYAELATVSVSDDGTNWTDFPCTALAAPYGSCAGWHPVYANPDDNSIDPRDPKVAGGDAFDLADIGVTEARYIRITDRPDQMGVAGTFDLDAVALVHTDCQLP